MSNDILRSYSQKWSRINGRQKSNRNWQGTLTEGSGVVSSESGVLTETPMTWKVAGGPEKGKANPEELISGGARHVLFDGAQLRVAERRIHGEKLEVTSVVTFGRNQAAA